MPHVQSITPCLWFDDEGEQAARFYVGIFANSKISSITHYGEAGHAVHGRKPGSVMTVSFELEGRPFLALNGGPSFKLNEAVSFMVMCETQKDIDYFWEKLGAGGDPMAQQCGWLKDKFGVSWQVVPTIVPEILMPADSEGGARAMNALMQMKKLDIAALKKARAG